MNKKKIEKIALAVGIPILLIIVLLAIFQFTKESENINVPNNPPIKEPEKIVFENQSAMDDIEIENIVEEKRTELRDFFKTIKYYNVSEVTTGYTSEDDKKFFALGETYVNRLSELLTVDAFGIYFDELAEITPRDDILINERIYLGRNDLFTSIFTNSAIATEGTNKEELILKFATNERIEAIVNIKYCEQETNAYGICQRDDKFNFILVEENGTWKISEFTKIIK